MDIGRDVLTQTLLGSTEAEKVFTPWWITVHHYLVYTIVILVSEKNEKYRKSKWLKKRPFAKKCK